MNLLECYAKVEIDHKNVSGMLDSVVVTGDNYVEDSCSQLRSNFREQFIELLSGHAYDEYVFELGSGLRVDVTDVLPDELFTGDDEEEFEQEIQDEFTELLAALLNAEVISVTFSENKVYYAV